MAAKAQEPRYRSIEDFLKDIKPWEYDFKYQYENFDADLYWNLDEDDDKPLVRLLKYKKELRNGDNFINSRIAFDCDGTGETEEYVCGLTREIYRTLWDWQDEYCPPKKTKKTGKTKVKRYGNIGTKGWLAGPDTMNSFFTVFDNYLEKLRGKKYSVKTLYNQLVVPHGKMKTVFGDLVSDKKVRDKWEEYAKLHHCVGNFILVPAGFNTVRSNQFDDFWDLSLFYLKQEAGNSWLNRDNIFTKYINYFFLWDYVMLDGSQYQVRSLRKGDFMKDGGEIINGNEKLSLTVDEMDEKNETRQFLANAMWAIKRRGIFMTAMLRIENALGAVKYAELREKVFVKDDPYSGYGEIKKALEDAISAAQIEEEK